MRIFIPLLIGVYFGIILVKSQVASWFRIQRMFHFEEAHMYLVLASAIAVGAVAILVIKRLGVHTIDGNVAQIKEKGFHKGVIAGGMLFGMGWVITGACPGPIFDQIGNGEWAALATFSGALVGAYLYAIARPRLPH